MKARLRLPFKGSIVLLVVLALLATGSDVAFALYRAHSAYPTGALRTTPSNATGIAISTAMTAISSPTPAASATSRPPSHPQAVRTATPAPNPAANNLVVYVDYRGGCYFGNNTKRPNPNLYFTNAYPGPNGVLNWSALITNVNQFFVHGDGGSGIDGGKTEMVEILPDQTAVGPLDIKVYDWGVPWTGVKGWWQGTMNPC